MADNESTSAAAGFKEMYCDNDGLGGKLAGKCSLQEQITHHMAWIFECLTEARLSSSTPSSSNQLWSATLPFSYIGSHAMQGKRVRSITTVGHSLGGALASLSAFDVSRQIRQAANGDEDKEVRHTAQPRVSYITHQSTTLIMCNAGICLLYSGCTPLEKGPHFPED